MRRHLISSSYSPLFSLQISHLLRSSSSAKHFSTYYNSSRRDEEIRNVRVSVWWDFENCHLPATVKPFKVAGTITAAVRANGIKGPIQINAFGDMFQLSRLNQEALSSTGINLTHVPSGGKNSADRSLLADLLYWVSQNPPPAHLFLISGDRDFSSILHKLRMNNYNILLASPENAPGVLCSAASIMWPWHDLLMGENLTGRYFNQPPDGPYGSWYGHYKAPLEDPFAFTEQPAVSQAERLPEPGSDSKLQMIPTGSECKASPIPKAVMKQIRHILKLHPKGISSSELRAQLEKYNVSLERPYYGYKKFSCFLASMPDILRLKPVGYGNYMIHGVTPKSAESFKRNPGDSDKGHQLDCEDTSTSDTVSRKLSLPTSPEPKLKEPRQELQQPILLNNTFTSPVDGKSLSPPAPEKLTSIDEKSLSPHSPDHMKPFLGSIDEKGVGVAEAQETEPDLLPAVVQEFESDVGYFKRIWRNWFGSRADVSGTSHNNQEQKHTSGDGTEKEGHETLEKHCMNVDNSGKGTCEEKTSTSQLVDPVPPASSSSSHNESALDSKTATSSEVNADKSNPGFFNQMVNWCKFWRSNPSDQSCDRAKLMESHSQEHKLFSNSFWGDMESFMVTPKGSVIVSESRTREEMALNLQKEGPLVLRSLAKSDLLQLVDLLISEKKWVEECPSQMLPFKLAQREGETSLNHSHHSSRLSSIFLGRPSKDEMQRTPGHDGEEKCKNIPHTGVSLPFVKNPLSEESRNEILADCQKLVNEKLKEFPNGYSIGLFRKQFRDRYGYHLDLKMLGYEKLANLLETLDGVKVGSSFIFPLYKVPEVFDRETVPEIKKHTVSHPVVNSDNQFSGSRKEDDSVSPWDELGPVTNTTFNKNVMEVAPRRKDMGSAGFDYEPSVSEFSDSDGEASLGTALEGQGTGRVNKEESSLMQILDSWHSSKDNSKTVDNSQTSPSSGVGTNLGYYSRKSTPAKIYNFVSEVSVDDKNKKPSEPRMES
ncbi:putative meiosis arrest female protein [Rosa chinensis]|uniref:Putative meiosis arrest female protein n=1 Tax=Rosa chinensis TaxID=74649 RepID=A0A2P6RRZ1_ROSCH|nr:uncharacterized protein LOC112183492 [Rosa chinensis]PRQ49200.1 putative meiosis arrest female protein [Rosa chinensis]